MKLRRALWLDNFEDGTIDAYWDIDGNLDSINEIYLNPRRAKDGRYGLTHHFQLTGAGGYARSIKTWDTPQIDLSEYDRIYYWVRGSETGNVVWNLRNNTTWGSDITGAGGFTSGEWTLDYVALSGTRDQLDGIRIKKTYATFSSSEVSIHMDTVVAVRTDTDHQYDFTQVQEISLTKTNGKGLTVKKIPGRRISIIRDRGNRSRIRSLEGEFKTVADKQAFEDMMRSGDNLFLLTGLGGQHGIVGRIFSKPTQQLAGITQVYPFTIALIESLESSP